MARFPRTGSVAWIGVRPARGTIMRAVDTVAAVAGKGLAGDRYIGASGKRGITLIQAEHVPVIASLAGHAAVAPDVLRRNLVVAGIPLIALKDRRFRIGEVVVQGTGPCDPCSRMEAAMGEGGGGLVVVGVDGSEESVAALRWAAGYARAAGATVQALIAWHYPDVAGMAPVGHAPAPIRRGRVLRLL